MKTLSIEPIKLHKGSNQHFAQRTRFSEEESIKVDQNTLFARSPKVAYEFLLKHQALINNVIQEIKLPWVDTELNETDKFGHKIQRRYNAGLTIKWLNDKEFQILESGYDIHSLPIFQGFAKTPRSLYLTKIITY